MNESILVYISLLILPFVGVIIGGFIEFLYLHLKMGTRLLKSDNTDGSVRGRNNDLDTHT
jgi:hypothetical protein